MAKAAKKKISTKLPPPVLNMTPDEALKKALNTPIPKKAKKKK